ncbi:MAG TPA: VTT domain-containing protein [Terracidiphilus sp.]|nr:VTT domain-containing protein [Terracidiphilus sp.]
MKQFFLQWMTKWKLIILPALIKLGFWGVFAVALLDASSIPVPMDAILAVFVWNNKPHFLLYCAMAAAGSALGGLVPYGIGRAGGELFLLKHINRQRLEQLRDRFERQEFLAVAIPSMLPPPTPWKLFVFAAGVFEMRVAPYLLAVFVGRMIRWITLSLLVLKLGPGAVDLVAHHALTALAIVFGLALIGFLVWWLRRKKAEARGPGL